MFGRQTRTFFSRYSWIAGKRGFCYLASRACMAFSASDAGCRHFSELGNPLPLFRKHDLEPRCAGGVCCSRLSIQQVGKLNQPTSRGDHPDLALAAGTVVHRTRYRSPISIPGRPSKGGNTCISWGFCLFGNQQIPALLYI